MAPNLMRKQHPEFVNKQTPSNDGDKFGKISKRRITVEDVTISQGKLYQFLLTYIYPIFEAFYKFELTGMENIPNNDRPILVIGHHSIHNYDIIPSNFCTYKLDGKVCRGLIHRIIYLTVPWLKFLGYVPGSRKTAVELLKSQNFAAVIPGGGEEAIQGWENAYKLNWVSSSGRKRNGFVAVAREANAIVIPCAGKNVQEMAFNIFGYLWNLLYLSKMFDYLLLLPGVWGWFFFQVKAYTWFFVWTYFSIPIPVAAGLVLGKPLDIQEGETDEEFSLRAQVALQKLIDQVNPGGLNYTRAIKQRFNLSSTKSD